MMGEFEEAADVSASVDGLAAISVIRRYPDGIVYRTVLHIQSADAAAVAEALERFAATRANVSLTLSDGTLRIFDMAPSEVINLELDRRDDVPQGGYDTCDLTPGSAATVVFALRALAD